MRDWTAQMTGGWLESVGTIPRGAMAVGWGERGRLGGDASPYLKKKPGGMSGSTFVALSAFC